MEGKVRPAVAIEHVGVVVVTGNQEVGESNWLPCGRQEVIRQLREAIEMQPLVAELEQALGREVTVTGQWDIGWTCEIEARSEPEPLRWQIGEATTNAMDELRALIKIVQWVKPSRATEEMDVASRLEEMQRRVDTEAKEAAVKQANEENTEKLIALITNSGNSPEAAENLRKAIQEGRIQDLSAWWPIEGDQKRDTADERAPGLRLDDNSGGELW